MKLEFVLKTIWHVISIKLSKFQKAHIYKCINIEEENEM